MIQNSAERLLAFFSHPEVQRLGVQLQEAGTVGFLRQENSPRG